MNPWDLPVPHVHDVVAGGDDIDGYGHVNNAVYLRWLDETAWSHSTALGLSPESCIGSRRGMAVLRSQLHYLAPALASDQLEVGTWIVGTDGRLRCARRFQIRRPGDGRTLLRALLHYVCIDLDSGRARRMPPEFVTRYRPLPEVVLALESQPEAFAPGVEQP
jgi:acyl-CoA thioester hydrolase